MTWRLWLADVQRACWWAPSSCRLRSHPVADGLRQARCGGCGPGAVWMGFNLLLMVIYPTFIARCSTNSSHWKMNRSNPRDASDERCGFPPKGLFVMDGSRRSAHANAYFTGFGAAKRVVFYDTLLRQLAVGEVEAVLAHELGHFGHWHIVQRIVMHVRLKPAGLCAAGLAIHPSWFYTGLGCALMGLSGPDWGSAPNDALALLLFMLVDARFSPSSSRRCSRSNRAATSSGGRVCRGTNGGADLSSACSSCTKTTPPRSPRSGVREVYYSHPPATERLARMQTLLTMTTMLKKKTGHPDPPCPDSYRSRSKPGSTGWLEPQWRRRQRRHREDLPLRQLLRDDLVRERGGLHRECTRPPPGSVGALQPLRGAFEHARRARHLEHRLRVRGAVRPTAGAGRRHDSPHHG